MYRYGVCRWAQDFEEVYRGRYYQGVKFSDKEGGPPVCVFYETPDLRDEAMRELCERYPNVIFAPFDVTNASQIQPGPLYEMTISDKGVLPK